MKEAHSSSDGGLGGVGGGGCMSVYMCVYVVCFKGCLGENWSEIWS